MVGIPIAQTFKINGCIQYNCGGAYHHKAVLTWGTANISRISILIFVIKLHEQFARKMPFAQFHAMCANILTSENIGGTRSRTTMLC